MKISGKTQMCIIIGDPVEHSLSPAMHNAAYEALGIDDQFVFTAARVKVEDVHDVVRAMRVMHIRGLTCTIPHKMEVMKYLDEIDPIAQKIGAVNTVVNENGILKGYNTDWIGAVKPLEHTLSGGAGSPSPKAGEETSPLQNKRVALLGAGGAARAIAYGIAEKGAHLTIFNRTQDKAHSLADELKQYGYSAAVGDDLAAIKGADIIINSTSLGMHPHEAESPLPAQYIQKHHIVFDAVYVPYETKLLHHATAAGATVIHGIKMLLHQGTAQFELYTGHKAPEHIMKSVLYDHFRITHSRESGNL